MRRIPELDGIRAVAVLMVLMHHMGFALKRVPGVVGPMCLGVDLFFVLSGYLITGIILRNAADRRFYLHFYARRALRIWPVYYLLVAVCVVLGAPWFGAGLDAGRLPYYLTYTQSPFLLARPYPELIHTWSLAVEEQFYLFWPPLLLLLGRRSVGPLAAVAAAVALVCRAAGSRLFPSLDGAFLFLIYARWDGLAFGAVLAAVLEGADAPARARLGRRFLALLLLALTYPLWRRPAAMTLGAALGGVDRSPAQFALDLLLFNAAVALLVGLAIVHSGRPWLAPLRNRVLGGIGLISYGLYLYHMPVFRLIGGTETVAMGLAGLGATFAAAVASWFLIERPILGLKARFEYRPPADRDGATGS